MSIFSRAEAIAKDIQHSAQQIFVKLFGQSAVDQFEADIKVIFQDDVIVIFQDAVVAAESLQVAPGVGGELAAGGEKRSAAFSQIVKDLEAKGISLATHVINLGIELVVGLLRAKTPATPVNAVPASSSETLSATTAQ